MTAIAPVRDCDGCTLCCKVMNVPELEKPAGAWCRHCTIGAGCGIHETRPDVCRRYFCMWTTNGNLGPEWKPSEAKFVISPEADGSRISIYVDTQRPDAWKREPFLSHFRRWAELGLQQGGQVVVFISRQALVILPDRVVDLGHTEPDDLILTQMVRTPQGIRAEPLKLKKDDPRAQQFLASQRRS